MLQIVHESKSVYQMREYYCDDANDVEECKNCWQELIADKEQHIDKLTALLKKELCK